MFRDLIRSHLEKCGYKRTMRMCTCVCAHRYTVHLSPLWKEPLSLDPSTQPSPQYYRLDVLDFWKRVINNGIYACECVHCMCVCVCVHVRSCMIYVYLCTCVHACGTMHMTHLFVSVCSCLHACVFGHMPMQLHQYITR